jgi:hypothetical protein
VESAKGPSRRLSSVAGGTLVLAGLAVATLSFGLLSAAGAPRPGVTGLKAQRASTDGRLGIVVVGHARGRRLGIQYAGGCRGLRLPRAAHSTQRRFATTVRRNGKRCTKRRMRRGRVRAWACAALRCSLRQVRIAHFRDRDGDGLGNLFERAILHTKPGNPDTDGDGIGDGEERRQGTNPRSPSSPRSPPPPELPPEEPLSPFAQFGCVDGAVGVSSANNLSSQVKAGNDVCVTAPVGNVRLEGLGDRAGVTISSQDVNGLIDELTVKETSNLTIQGARLHSIEIRRANGTRVISSQIGGTKSSRIEDQLIFMPESSSDVTIESNDIGWTIADSSGNTGYGCRCYGNLDRLRFVGNKVHDLAADGFQGVGGEDVLIDRNEIGPVGANPGSSEHSDNIQITGNDENLRITNNWIHHQGYYEGGVANNAGSTYIHGGSNGTLLYYNNLIETAQGRTEICGLGTGGSSRSNITIERNTWVDGGKAFNGFPGFEWDCDSGSNDTITRNIAVDPDGGFADDGFNAAIVPPNLFGSPSLVTLDPAGNCTSPNCNPPGQDPIGYRKPANVHW